MEHPPKCFQLVYGQTGQVALDVNGADGEVQLGSAGVGGGIAVHIGDHKITASAIAAYIRRRKACCIRKRYQGYGRL